MQSMWHSPLLETTVRSFRATCLPFKRHTNLVSSGETTHLKTASSPSQMMTLRSSAMNSIIRGAEKHSYELWAQTLLTCYNCTLASILSLLKIYTDLLSTVTVAEVLSSVDSQTYSPLSSSISWWMVKLRSLPWALIVCWQLWEISLPFFSHWTSPFGLLISHCNVRRVPFRALIFSNCLINLTFISVGQRNTVLDHGIL